MLDPKRQQSRASAEDTSVVELGDDPDWGVTHREHLDERNDRNKRTTIATSSDESAVRKTEAAHEMIKALATVARRSQNVANAPCTSSFQTLTVPTEGTDNEMCKILTITDNEGTKHKPARQSTDKDNPCLCARRLAHYWRCWWHSVQERRRRKQRWPRERRAAQPARAITSTNSP